MLNNKLIQNYTNALFDNAAKNAVEGKILEELKVIDLLIQNNPKVQETLVSPIVKYADKLVLVELITQNLETEPTVAQFLLTLLKHARLALLPNIIKLYQLLLNNQRNIKMVKVTSSELLGLEEKSWLQKYLEDNFKQHVTITFEDNQALIGGIIIEYDNIVEDYSIAGVLKKINKNMKNVIL